MLWRNIKSLPLSPVYKAFPNIPWDPLERRLSLSASDKSLLRSAEENPLEYTLAEKDDANNYIRLLLKVLDQIKKTSTISCTALSSSAAGDSAAIVSAPALHEIKLDQASPLDDDQAMQVLYDFPNSVVKHYIITKLYEVIACLHDNEMVSKHKNNNSNKNTTTTSTQIQIYSMFYNPIDGTLLDDWRPLLRLLYMGGSGDPWVQRGASLCLAHILRAGCPSQVEHQHQHQKLGGHTTNTNTHKSTSSSSSGSSTSSTNPVEEPLQAVVSWLASRLQSSAATTLGVVTPTLTVLATCHEARIVLDRAGGIGYLSRHLRLRTNARTTSSSTSSAAETSTNTTTTTTTSRQTSYDAITNSSMNMMMTTTKSTASVQQLYELCFCLWTMTHESDDEELISHFHRDGAIASLCDLVAMAPREKVVRLAVSALHNLANCDPITTTSKRGSSGRDYTPITGTTFLTEMIGCGLLKSIDTLKERPWTDPDIVDDLDALHKRLHENFREMTRWEVYKSEVESGRLSWGMVHTEKFFKENAKLMEGSDGDFRLVKRLIKLLASNDDEVVCIACFDIGEFVRHYPNGRSIAKRLGAKDLIMSMIEHDNSDVQRYALVCMSKLLVNNWKMVA